MPVTLRQIERALRKAGFIRVEGAKHIQWRHPDGRVIYVPRHTGDVPLGTQRAIERQAKIRIG